MPEPVNHHLVSKAYQKNFANAEKRVAIVRVTDGESPRKLRAIKSNWREPNFNTMFGKGGEEINHLEFEFARVESRVLHVVRQVSSSRCGDEEHNAIVGLFALHLVRSLALREAQKRLYEDHYDDLLDDVGVDTDGRVIAKFREERGREPRPGELMAIAKEIADDRERRNVWRVDSMTKLYNGFAEMLGKSWVQVVEIESESVGSFVLGDVPVVHAHRGDGLFGFRDGLALGDADFVCAPLTRRTAALFTAGRLPHFRVRTKKKLDQLNYAFIRAARFEIACHPDDQLAAQRLCRYRPYPYPDLP